MNWWADISLVHKFGLRRPVKGGSVFIADKNNTYWQISFLGILENKSLMNIDYCQSKERNGLRTKIFKKDEYKVWFQ